ncbi:enhancer of polycomb-like protein 2-like [Iris pallida]|uniref:Enhancer of polycomb-like protein n=1 Tax=Iris pallida TaxID=29817 RepID=A0AAX6HWY3_IRIPA|nr:enhancer of polycomb-like protein 2-like [Iris pallida]
MSRLSFRPRPVDFHKKLPIIRSVQEFEDDEAAGASTRNSQLLRIAADTDNEVHQVTSRKISSEIPTPQYNVVDTYERDYTCTFSQPNSYLRGRGARGELGEFVEYDLDSDDEDWLQEFNNEKRILSPEKLEALLCKLEVLDHKTRERAGVIPTFGVPVPVYLQLDAAAEALQTQSVRFVYNYWKAKREQWQKPILRRLQPAPPANDTNPYNTFRPREKAHRLHTRRMQRRENNVQSFEKLRQVRRNLDQAKTVLEALIKREEKKREVMESEVSLQRIQIKYKLEAQLVEDGMTFPVFPSNSCKFESSEDDIMDSDDATYGYPCVRPAMRQNHRSMDRKLVIVPPGRMKRELKQRTLEHKWPLRKDPDEPVLLFKRPLDPDKLAAAGIVQPPAPPIENGSVVPPYRFNGRIGRGGRIIFDRWRPESSPYPPPIHRPPQPDG